MSIMLSYIELHDVTNVHYVGFCNWYLEIEIEKEQKYFSSLEQQLPQK